MITFRSVYWLQFHEKFGPIVINLSRVMNDLTTIAITYLIICMGFSFGLIFVLNESHLKNDLDMTTKFEGNVFKEVFKSIRCF